MISLTRGFSTIVDECDYARLSKWSWQYLSGYAARSTRVNGKKVAIRMHREIANTPNGMDTDHINGNKLDNRRSNLRVCSRLQNMANQSVTIRNKSGFKGVSWCVRAGAFTAQISIYGKKKFLGYFKNASDAARVYQEYAAELHGEFVKF